MIDSFRDRDPLELLADEFAARLRRGESPSAADYAARHPEYADQIEDLFGAVAMLEQFRGAERTARETADRRASSAKLPDRLGDFRIIREVGRGGMGIVLEAEQQSLGRRVAVKVLPKYSLVLDAHLRRFQREAQTAAGLHHTNIVPVFGVGEQDGLHYYVMPLIRGVGLDEMIRELRGAAGSSTAERTQSGASDAFDRDVNAIIRTLIARKFTATLSAAGGPRPRNSHTDYWRHVARIGVQAAEALDYAHAQGTLHRDIKPANLLIDEDGVVRVADFGLAGAVDYTDASRGDEVVGTPRYMAPEQLCGAADARSDVYALGMTLYELLTLRPALEDMDGGLHGRQTGREPVRPRKIVQAIPRDLETIVLKCLAREPSNRYPAASDLAADLGRFLENRPIRARRVSPVERLWRWGRRNPALAAVSALAASLLIAIGGVGLSGHLQTRLAYTKARAALTDAEATSRLALDVLDDIYLQLSPDRVWILSDAGGGGEVCVCLGLRSSAGSVSSTERAAMQVQASEETASLLEGLMVFYDRLAERAGNDSEVMLQSAIASRRVGDIRQLLGQLDEAEGEYARAIQKLKALSARPNANTEIHVELARNYNELGNVQSVRFEPGGAYESHRMAIAVLESCEPAGELPAEYRYELARTLYLLANKHTIELGNRRGQDRAAGIKAPGPRRYDSRECRDSAIRILEQLTREDPNIPDYRFLLALCHRPSGASPARDLAGDRGRQRAIAILEELKAQYPEVVDYRYELAATHAWIHVGLFPWQSPTSATREAERSLLKALDESRWLVDHNPSIPHYVLSRTLILAKLGTVCWRARRFTEAEDYFQEAIQMQSVAIAKFPDLPPRNRVLLEFMRLRLTRIRHEHGVHARDLAAIGGYRDSVEACIDSLAELATTAELADDRLLWNSLPLSYDVLSHVLAEMGEHEEAEEARENGAKMRRKLSDGQRQYWRL